MQFSVKITPPDIRIEDPIFEGQVEVDIPSDGKLTSNEISMLIKKQNSDAETGMGGEIVRGSASHAIKKPFFEEDEQNIKITFNVAFCIFSRKYFEAHCNIRYGIGLLPVQIQFNIQKNDPITKVLFDQDVTIQARQPYLESGHGQTNLNISADQKRIKKEDLGIQKDEPACMELLNKGYYNCEMASLFNRKTTNFSWKTSLFNFNSFDYDESGFDVRKQELIDQIKVDAAKFNNILAELNLSGKQTLVINDHVRVVMIDAATSITDSILVHLGIKEKGYEMFDDSINDFFTYYIFQFYLGQFSDSVGESNQVLLREIVKNIKAGENIGPVELNENEILLNNEPMLVEHNPNLKNMIFLRDLFISQEKMFFKIMGHIELENWE
jgi:hypothetical protein